MNLRRPHASGLLPGPAPRLLTGLPQAAGQLLHLRSRALAQTLLSLAGVSLAAGLALEWLTTLPSEEPLSRAFVTIAFPVLAASAVGISLHSHSPDADRTASRRWWPLRTGYLLTMTALASVLMSLSVPGDPAEFGVAAMVRNTIGATGVTALFSTVLGARISWLPMFAYGGAALLVGPREPGGADALWHWLMQPGPQSGAWVSAVAAFAVGAGVHALRGPLRTDDSR